MNNQDYTALIEAYLDGALPEEKHREVEQRMEADKAFRQEVRLQRQLREHLGDPERWKHYSALEQAKKTPLLADDNPASARTRNWKWLGLLVFLLVVGVFVWQLSKPAVEPAPSPPTEKLPAESPAVPQKEELKETPQKLPPVEQNTEKGGPIAKADPANFIPNPSMEAFVVSGMKSGNLDIKINTPLIDADFSPDKKGAVLVRFSGTVEDVSEDIRTALVLAIYNNNDTGKPLVSFPLGLKKDPAGNLTYDIQQKLGLQPGLYYFTIEQQGEMACAGRFTIGKSK